MITAIAAGLRSTRSESACPAEPQRSWAIARHRTTTPTTMMATRRGSSHGVLTQLRPTVRQMIPNAQTAIPTT